ERAGHHGPVPGRQPGGAGGRLDGAAAVQEVVQRRHVLGERLVDDPVGRGAAQLLADVPQGAGEDGGVQVHAAVVEAHGDADVVAGGVPVVVEVAQGAVGGRRVPAQPLAQQACVRVAHRDAERVHLDGVAEVVGQALVHGARLVDVQQAGGVLDDAVGHLVA